MKIPVLEGCSKRFTVQLHDANGAAVDATDYDWQGGAESSKSAVDMQPVHVSAEGVELLLPGITPEKEINYYRTAALWNYQLRAVHKTTRAVYVVLQGELEVLPWIGATEAAPADTAADAVSVQAALNNGTVAVNVVLDAAAGVTLTDEQKALLIAPAMEALQGKAFATLATMPETAGECDAWILPPEAVPHDVRLDEVVVPAVANTCNTPVYLAVFAKSGSASLLLGVSDKAVTWPNGVDVRWGFSSGITVPEGYRVECFLATGPDVVTATDAPAPGVRIKLHDANTGNGQVRYQKSWYRDRLPYVLFAQSGHAGDTTAHLSATEHTALDELLAKKDALLALVNS